MKAPRIIDLAALLAAGFAGACGSDGTATDVAPYARDKLLDPETCNECHQDHYREWSGSMHAYASTDPVFRAMNARGQKETNGTLGDFCVKCHAPMAVNEKVITDYSDLSSVPQTLQGITCYFCHNVEKVTDTHNNPLVLANDVTMRGGILRPLKYKGHAAEYSTLYDDVTARAGVESSNLCGSCHDIVVPAHYSGAAEDVPLEQTFTQWKGSAFADPTSMNRLNCTSAYGCHMTADLQKPIASPPLPHPTMPTRPARHEHDFPAVDTALVDGFPQKDAQLAAVLKKLGLEFRVEICADPDLGSGVAVYLENLTAGHNFPSGASQDRRLWVELHVYQKEMEVFSSGVVPPGTASTSIADTWVLYDLAFKKDGTTPAHMFWDVATVNPASIPVSTNANPMGNEVGKTYRLPTLASGRFPQPDHVTITLWLEPIGTEVIDDMIASTFLDKGFKDIAPRFKINIPSATDAGAVTDVTFDWTVDVARKNNLLRDGRFCIENTPPRFTVTPPPQ